METRLRWPIVGCAVGIVVAASGLGISIWADRPWPEIGRDLLIGLAYILAGTVAWARRPGNSIGPVMLAAGIAWYIPNFLPVPIPAVTSLAFAGAWMTNILVAFLLLAYPNGRLPSLSARVVFAVALVGSVAQIAARLLFLDNGVEFNDATGPSDFRYGCACANPFAVLPDDRLFGDAMLITRIVTIVSAILILALIVQRWWMASSASRRQLVPVLFGGAVGAVAFVTDILAFSTVSGENAVIAIVSVGEDVARAAVPIGFLLGLLRIQIDRGLVGRLLVELGDSASSRTLTRVLAKTLHDPTVRVAYWSQSAERFVDERGVHADLASAPGRAVLRVERGGEPLCLVEYDEALADQPELLAGVAAALRIAIDRDRLAGTVRAQADDARNLLRGYLTFLYSDIEGSSALVDQLGPGYAAVLTESRRIQRSITRRHGGREVDSRADEFFAVFPLDASPGAAAVEIQRAFRDNAWPNGAAVLVRVGIHSAETEIGDGGYVGIGVHMVARLGSAGHGGQLVLSEAGAAAIASDLPAGARLEELGHFELRGIPGRQRLFQLVVPDLPADFAPLRAAALAAE